MDENLQQNIAPAPQKTEFENPGEKLKLILKNIEDAGKKGNSTLEKSYFKEAENLFKIFTGQDLKQKAKSEAEKELQAEGRVLKPTKTFSTKERFDKNLEAFKFKQQLYASRRAWEMISEERKKEFLNDINNFIAACEQKIEEFSKAGFGVSKEIFFIMLANGYMLLDTKKSFFTGKVLIPVLLGAGAYKYDALSLKEFANASTMMQKLLDMVAEQATQDRIEKDLRYAKWRWQKRKARKVKEILASTANTMKEENIEEAERMEIRKVMENQIKEKIRKEVEAEERASLEELSNIGEVGALEKLRDFEKEEIKTDKAIQKEIKKLEKGLEKDVKERMADEKKINKVLKKQLDKGKISKKRSSYLKEVAKNQDINDELSKQDEPPAEEVQPEEIPLTAEGQKNAA